MKPFSFPKTSFLLFGALTVALFTSACSTVVLDKEGEMEAVYVAGEFRMLVNGTAPATASATSAAFKQLGIFQLSSEQQTYSATLKGRTPKDEKVTVNVAEINSRQSMLRIRVNNGDLNYSRKLFDQIDRNVSNRGGW